MTRETVALFCFIALVGLVARWLRRGQLRWLVSWVRRG
jgi:hypothetical protein